MTTIVKPQRINRRYLDCLNHDFIQNNIRKEVLKHSDKNNFHGSNYESFADEILNYLYLRYPKKHKEDLSRGLRKLETSDVQNLMFTVGSKLIIEGMLEFEKNYEWLFDVEYKEPLSHYVKAKENSQGSFAAIRKHDVHTGVDLYCNEGDEVHAIEKGTVINIDDFTGSKVGSPWWRDTRSVQVKGESGIILYGEVQETKDLKVGDTVEAGVVLANVLSVLEKGKKRPTTMLHLELYDNSYVGTGEIWKLDGSMPTHLCNPNVLLLKNKRIKVSN